jgi:hypothetical protein
MNITVGDASGEKPVLVMTEDGKYYDIPLSKAKLLQMQLEAVISYLDDLNADKYNPEINSWKEGEDAVQTPKRTGPAEEGQG